jgi:hypothetical protein
MYRKIFELSGFVHLADTGRPAMMKHEWALVVQVREFVPLQCPDPTCAKCP